jgi:PGF-pre-PGF domain-containing protein
MGTVLHQRKGRRIRPPTGEIHSGKVLQVAALVKIILVLGLCSFLAPPATAASVVATISLPTGGATSFSNLAANPSTNLLYVGSYPPGDIYAIDRSSYTWTSIPAGVTYGDISVNPVTNKIYHANQGSASVTVIDGISNTISSYVGVPGYPTGNALNENTNKVYVSSQGGGDTVYVIDGSSDTVVAGPIILGGVAGPVIADPVANRIYARASWDTRVIDGSSDSVTASIPSFITDAVNPVTNKVYGACSDGNFCIVNALTYVNELSVSWGTWPGSMDVNQNTNRVYVTLGGYNTMLILNGTTGQEITRVPVGNNPQGVSVDPDTNRVYVANANDGTITVIQDTAPGAGFTGTPTSGTGPLTVAFTDTSDNSPTSWNWDFGDGSPENATDENPVHTYAGAGTYTVSLTATNATGSDTITRTAYISVVIPPVASFSGTPTSGTAPLSVTFTDASTNTPTSWSWDFGDGGTDTVQNPTYIYTSPGTYTVSLTASNAAGSDTATQTDYISVVIPPVASFSGTPTSGTAPLPVTFTDASTNTPTSWNWSFGDGSLVNATDQNPVHTYASAGTYTVSLNATNAGGSDTLTRAGYITVNAASVPTTAPPPSHPSGGNGGGYSSSSSQGSTAVAAPGAGKGETITLSFDQPATSAAPAAINQVLVVPARDVGPVLMRAEPVNLGSAMQLHGRQVIGYEEITVVNAEPNTIDHGEITFTVNGAWLTAHQVSPAEIVMERYHDNQWAELTTTFDHESGNVFYFTAETPGFSYFAIAVRQAEAQATPSPVPSTEATIQAQGTTSTGPVATRTTAVPVVHGPVTGIPPLAVEGLGGIVMISVVLILIRRWWIRKQNPALFRELN